MHAERKSVELVSEALPGRDDASPNCGHSVHLRWMNSMEVYCVRVWRVIDKTHPQAITLTASKSRARNPPVIDPSIKKNTRRDLDRLLPDNDFPLAHRTAVRH